MKVRIPGLVFLAAMLIVAVPAFAGTVTFDFSEHGTGDLGPGTIAFHAGGLELDVTAWLSNGVQGDVFYKNNSGDEVGLGIAGTDDNEIVFPSNFLQFDLSKLSSIGSLNITIGFNSTTSGESWGLSYSDVNGQMFTPGSLAHGSTETTVTVSTTGAHYLDISSDSPDNSTGSDGNVLVASTSATQPTPEPTSLLLLGSGLIGMGQLLRRTNRLSSRS